MAKRIVCASLAAITMSLGAFFATSGMSVQARDAEAPAAEAKPQIEAEAARVLRAASSYLAEAKALTFKSEEWVDVVLADGQKLQTTRTASVTLKRPDRLQIEVTSPRRSHGLWYSNKTLTFLDRTKNFYATAPAAATIDETIDAIEDRFGIAFPMADLLVADPYANATARVKTGVYLGKATVLGVACRHLAFTGENLDWQIWVQEGAKPLPRKIVLTYKKEAGAPQRTAILSDWDVQGPVSDETFTFVPPQGALRIEMIPREAPATAPRL